MSTNQSRSGSIVVKFPEDVDMQLAIYAIKMGKRNVSRNGREMIADHTKADAVVELVMKALDQQEKAVTSIPRSGGNRRESLASAQ